MFLAKSLMSSMFIKWLIFSCDLLSLYPAVHFLRMWLSGIMAIEIVMVIVHFPGKYLFGFLFLLSFFFLLSIPLSRFIWSSRSTVRLDRAFYTFLNSVIYSLGGAYRKVFLLSIQAIAMFFTTALADNLPMENNSPQVSLTLLGILADLNNAVVTLVSPIPLISKFSSPFINPLLTVTSAPNTISINVHFSSLAKSRYLSFFSLSFLFILQFVGMAKSAVR